MRVLAAYIKFLHKHRSAQTPKSSEILKRNFEVEELFITPRKQRTNPFTCIVSVTSLSGQKDAIM